MPRIRYMGFLFIFFIIKCTCHSQVCFMVADSFALGITIVSADFNGDGKADIVATNGSPNNVSIFLGTGTGTFGTATNFVVGSTPYQVVSEDFNGDGKVDLAVANRNSNNVSVLIGTGAGNFSLTTNYSVGGNPYYLTCADFNADGIKDLAVSNFSSDNVSLLLGTGAGNFGIASTPLNFSTGSHPSTITTADFNMDGKADLALTFQFGSNVSVFFGTGVGTFGISNNFGVGTTPNIMSSDFNGDSFPDIATANSSTNNISVLLGTGTGSFSVAINYPVGVHPEGVTSADFNKDGLMDLAVCNVNSSNLSILLGIGSGNFGLATNFVTGSSYPSCIINADFNGDTMPDIAVLGSDIGVLLNCSPLGISNFSVEKEFAIYPNPATNSITVSSNQLADNSQIQITDILGKKIKSYELKVVSDKNEIGISDLKEGIYFVSAKTANGTSTQKIIVQR